MSQGLITRRILHPRWTLTYRDYKDLAPGDLKGQLRQIDRRQLSVMIDRAKTYLVRERNFRPGDRVFLATTQWPEFPAWFFAVAELGGTFLVSSGPGLYNHRVVDYRLAIYGSVDHFIWWTNDEPSFSGVKDQFIDETLILEDLPRDPQISQQINCGPQTLLLMSTSSGTTSRPKLIKHDHDFFWQLMRRNQGVFKLGPEDLCMHTKNLHHGSVMGVYLLPSLNRCRRHYWQSSLNSPRGLASLLDCLDQGLDIRRMMIFRSSNLDDLAQQLKPLEHELEILYLARARPESLSRLVQLGASLTSVFGCTETSGPLFLQRHHRDSSVELNDFGQPLDDFYSLGLTDEGLLTVKMPTGDEVTTGDLFTVDSRGHWRFHKRTLGFRRDDVPVYLDLIAELLAQSSVMPQGWRREHEYDLCIDPERAWVIMRTDREIDLGPINQFLEKETATAVYRIDDQVTGPRQEFIHGIKLDCELIRDISRSQQ